MVVSAAPQVSLDLSLSGQDLDQALSSLLAQISSPLPTLSFASSRAPPSSKCTSHPQILQQPSLHPLATSRNEGATKHHILAKNPSRPLSSKHIISLLNSLDKLDADMTVEVQRVKENIKEARSLIEEYKIEKRARGRTVKEDRERVTQETKTVDSDFWAAV